jgi:serine protease inhibitor
MFKLIGLVYGSNPQVSTWTAVRQRFARAFRGDNSADLILNLNAFGESIARVLHFTDEKTFISPFSIFTSLSMLFNGLHVNSNSYNEMASIYGTATVEVINSGFQEVLQSMTSAVQNTHGYRHEFMPEFDLACSIWVKPSLSMTNEYKEKMTSVFKAEPS